MGAKEHGHASKGNRSPEYIAWLSMRQRCSDPRHVQFHNYGGRGISVCARWADSFQAFLADMGAKPSRAHSIDRIDVDGPYSPTNCRWANAKQQQNNRRDNVLIDVGGLKLTRAEWSERIGISIHAVRNRADRFARGEISSAAFMAPRWSSGRLVDVDGRKCNITEAAMLIGITHVALRHRLKAFDEGAIPWALVISKVLHQGRRRKHSPAIPSSGIARRQDSPPPL